MDYSVCMCYARVVDNIIQCRCWIKQMEMRRINLNSVFWLNLMVTCSFDGLVILEYVKWVQLWLAATLNPIFAFHDSFEKI
jgi:hypothetical protein